MEERRGLHLDERRDGGVEEGVRGAVEGSFEHEAVGREGGEGEGRDERAQPKMRKEGGRALTTVPSEEVFRLISEQSSW